MFAVVVTFQIHEEHLSSFMKMMLINARSSLRDEKRCRQFDVCTDESRPNEVFLYELYDDEAAFEAHKVTLHYLAFQDVVAEMIASKDVRCYSRVAQ